MVENEKNLSLKKYFNTGLGNAAMFACCFLLLLVAGIAINDKDAWLPLVAAMLFTALWLLTPSVCYFSMYYRYKKKCVGLLPREGVVQNWSLSSFDRFKGSVMIKDGGREYHSSSIFSKDEAREMVGKTVYYIILDDTLIIYEVKITE